MKQIAACVGLAGKIKCVAINPEGKERILADWFDNLITDNGMNLLGSNTQKTLGGCHVGSGSTPPTNSDTHLQSFIAGVTNPANNGLSAVETAVPYYVSVNVSFSFAAGAAAGNISEIGISSGASPQLSSALLFSRALVKDASGNPTTITVLSDEILQVFYELRFYVPAADITGSFNMVIDGVSTPFGYTLRPAKMNSVATSSAMWSINPNGFTRFDAQNFANMSVGGGITNGVLGDVNSIPTGTAATWPAAGATSATYVNGNFYNDFTWTLSVGDGNTVGNITCLAFSFTLCGFQMQLGTPVAKTNTKKFSITMRLTWARA